MSDLIRREDAYDMVRNSASMSDALDSIGTLPAVTVQAQIDAARIAALQEAERAVLKLITGSKKSTIFDADAAILALIRKRDQP
jgi:hypothetical protein